MSRGGHLVRLLGGVTNLRITPLATTGSDQPAASTARAAARAHAQKNAAAVILAIARLAAPDLPPQHRERFERLREAASRLVHLFNEELREALPRDVDVKQLFGTACDLVRDRAEADGVALVASCAGGRLRGDAEALTEALVNLIGNAIDASPAGYRVRVDARIGPTGGQRWVIEDAGKGMPAHVLAGIGGVVPSERPLGSGFGIALAATTIEAHGGTLRFEARSPQGTRVVIDLPPAIQLAQLRNDR
jgi:two-component system sensor histidine kinase FlrB